MNDELIYSLCSEYLMVKTLEDNNSHISEEYKQQLKDSFKEKNKFEKHIYPYKDFLDNVVNISFFSYTTTVWDSEKDYIFALRGLFSQMVRDLNSSDKDNFMKKVKRNYILNKL